MPAPREPDEYLSALFAMNVAALILTLLASSSAWASSETTSLRIGFHYSANDLPEGCRSEGGGLIGANHDLSVAQFNCRGQRVLTFNRLTHKDSKGSPHWEIVDLVNLPMLRKGESINDIDCIGPMEGYTLAIARWREAKTRTHASQISYAVHLNISAGRFETVNPNLVKCEYFEDRN